MTGTAGVLLREWIFLHVMVGGGCGVTDGVEGIDGMGWLCHRRQDLLSSRTTIFQFPTNIRRFVVVWFIVIQKFFYGPRYSLWVWIEFFRNCWMRPLTVELVMDLG